MIKMNFFLLFLLYTPVLFAQNVVMYQGEKINELNPNFNKIGLWKIFDADRGISIMCEMADDEFT